MSLSRFCKRHRRPIGWSVFLLVLAGVGVGLCVRPDLLRVGLSLGLRLGRHFLDGPLLLSQLLCACRRLGTGGNPAQDDGEPAERECQGDEPDYQERVCAAHSHPFRLNTSLP